MSDIFNVDILTSFICVADNLLDTLFLTISCRAYAICLAMPAIYNLIGRRFGLLRETDTFRDINEFQDIVIAAIGVRCTGAHFLQSTCLDRAILRGDVERANSLFDIMLFEGYSLLLDCVIASAFESGSRKMVQWARVKYRGGGDYIVGPHDVDWMYKSGDVKLLDENMPGCIPKQFTLASGCERFLHAAIESDNHEMIERAIGILIQPSSSQKIEVRPTLDYNIWNNACIQSLILGCNKSFEYLKTIGIRSGYGFKIPNRGHFKSLPLDPDIYNLRSRCVVPNVENLKILIRTLSTRLNATSLICLSKAFGMCEKSVDVARALLLHSLKIGALHIANYIVRDFKLSIDDLIFITLRDRTLCMNKIIIRWFERHGVKVKTQYGKIIKSCGTDTIIGLINHYNLDSSKLNILMDKTLKYSKQCRGMHNVVRTIANHRNYVPSNSAHHERLMSMMSLYEHDPRIALNTSGSCVWGKACFSIHTDDSTDVDTKLFKMKQYSEIDSIYGEFLQYYIMTDDEISQALQDKGLHPFITLNKLAAALYLTNSPLFKKVMTLNEIFTFDRLNRYIPYNTT